MTSPRSQLWENWAGYLQRLGLSEFAAAILEAARPVSLVGAQLVYISQPLLSAFLPPEHLAALAGTLEDPEETRAFLEVLRQGEQEDPL